MTETNLDDRPSLAEAIAAVARDVEPDPVNVAALGIVVSYDAETSTAEVQPAISPVYEDANGDRVVIKCPSIPDVPVEWPATSAASLHLPLAKGDHVLLVIRDRCHDEVDDDGIPASGTVAPKSTRRFSWADAVAIPVRGGPKNGLATGAFHASDPVLFLEGSRAVRIGDSDANLRLAIAEVLRPFLADLVTWATSHVHGFTGTGTVNAPTVSPPSVPSLDDLASGRVLVDT